MHGWKKYFENNHIKEKCLKLSTAAKIEYFFVRAFHVVFGFAQNLGFWTWGDAIFAPQAEIFWGLGPWGGKSSAAGEKLLGFRTWGGKKILPEFLVGVLNLGGKFCSGLCGGKISEAKIISRSRVSIFSTQML